LVEDLKETEIRFINLFAKSLENTINSDDGNINFITQEILFPNKSIPLILTDENGNIYSSKNIDLSSGWTKEREDAYLRNRIEAMRELYEPLTIEGRDPVTGEVYWVQYLYYENSFLLTQLSYYPYVQLSVIAIFGILAYLAFSSSKTAEQNLVWVGMAKETAHQLGTPLSSLMAWLEHMKIDPKFKDHPMLGEINKDVDKLEMITERFSNIGSIPVLKEENVTNLIQSLTNYLRSRISSKVNININSISDNITAKINAPLFEWVIENLCKNAVDAMSGVGSLNIKIMRGSDHKVFIDISDNGKGIPKSKIKQVFHPGYTTKKRGWGLGLTLVKRIIENYHEGRIFVKSSDLDQGTTFRIVLSSKI
jgi:signal transduction histidine kinase